MIEEIYSPKIEPTTEDKRKEGISAFLRVRNGEEFLRISVLSIINQIDELVCVVNRSTDKTLEILEDLQSQFKDKIKIYDYKPEVYPPGSDGHKKSSFDSPNNLSFYYNFALSKTSYNYIFKFDDDEIFFPSVMANFHKYCKLFNRAAIGLRGINLIDFDKKLYINKKYHHTSGGDTLFFKYNDSCLFKKNNKCEFFYSNLKRRRMVDCFYHLKFCKSDRGQNNYDLLDNPSSEYINIGKTFLKSIKHNLIYIEEFIKNKKYPDPFALGFNFVNESIKKYNYLEFQKIENND